MMLFSMRVPAAESITRIIVLSFAVIVLLVTAVSVAPLIIKSGSLSEVRTVPVALPSMRTRPMRLESRTVTFAAESSSSLVTSPASVMSEPPLMTVSPRSRFSIWMLLAPDSCITSAIAPGEMPSGVIVRLPVNVIGSAAVPERVTVVVL